MSNFDDTIDIDKQDYNIFDSVRAVSGKAIQKIYPEIKLWLDDNTSRYCISNDCKGKREIRFKDIVGQTDK